MNDIEFGKQLELNYDKIYGMLVKMVRDIDKAKDLIQTTMLRAWTFRHQFNGTSAFSTWLGTIAINVFRSEIRSKFKKSLINFSDLRVDEENDGSMDEVLHIFSNEDIEREFINKDLVAKLFKNADVSQKTLMIAKMYDRSPEKLGISEEAWKARKFRAQHETRDRMQQLSNGEISKYKIRSNEKQENRRLGNMHGGLIATALGLGMHNPKIAAEARLRIKDARIGIHTPGLAKTAGEKGRCARFRINKGKPCVCGQHNETRSM